MSEENVYELYYAVPEPLTSSDVTTGYSDFVSHKSLVKHHKKVNRPISTPRLNVLLRLHLVPINLVVFQGPNIGKSNLEVSFALNMLSALLFAEL